MTQPRAPRKFLVTRHEGAIKWYRQSGHFARTIEMTHFDTAKVLPGDIVIGTLPMHQAAAVCAAGARYWHLALDVPPERRGGELTADDMRAFGARLEEFRLEWLGVRASRTPEVDEMPTDTGPLPTLHVCVATGETLANLVPALHMPWDDLVVLATPEMQDNASHLQLLLARPEVQRSQPGLAARVHRLDLASPTTLGVMEFEMRRAAAELRQRFPEHDMVVNATGGYKFMSLALLDAFRPHARILYCHMQQDVMEDVWPRAAQTIALPPDVLDLETQLLGNRTRIAGSRPLDDETLAKVRARARITASMALAREAGTTPRLVSLLHAEGNAAGRTVLPDGSMNRAFNPERTVLPPRNMVHWQQALLREMNELGMTVDRSSADNPWAFAFADADAAGFAAGGYLEEFALLSVLDLGLPLCQLGWGVHVDALNPLAGRAPRPLNELDIALVWRNRLLVIECKAGSQLSHSDTSKPQDIVNKLGMLRREKAGPFGSAWLLSRTPLTTSRHGDVVQRLADLHIDGVAGGNALAKLPKRLRQWCGPGVQASTLDWNALML